MQPRRRDHLLGSKRMLLGNCPGSQSRYRRPRSGCEHHSIHRVQLHFAESAGTATLTVQRTSDITTEVGVDYVSADGTATNGLKYTAASGRLAFGASETNKTIMVPILNEGFVEGTKTFKVFLSNPTVGAVLGARTNATVSITDNDFGIQFQFAAYSPGEDTNAVMIGVVRGNDGILPVTVDLFTTDLLLRAVSITSAPPTLCRLLPSNARHDQRPESDSMRVSDQWGWPWRVSPSPRVPT